jgi:hypothetical protein
MTGNDRNGPVETREDHPEQRKPPPNAPEHTSQHKPVDEPVGEHDGDRTGGGPGRQVVGRDGWQTQGNGGNNSSGLLVRALSALAGPDTKGCGG